MVKEHFVNLVIQSTRRFIILKLIALKNLHVHTILLE